jgi:ubiquinone/menaquinone biosynthesis C-methylase UbiE
MSHQEAHMARDLFNTIAGVYGWFHRYQMRRFSTILDEHSHQIPLSPMRTVCDVGCGTGALCAVLHLRGLQVTGVEPAVKMLDVARNKVPDVSFITGDAVTGLPFADNSFDLVFTSYVAHGMPPSQRLQLYQELKRIASKAVIVHDYNEKRAILTTIIEFLEQGDYFGFIKRREQEMLQIFPSVEIIPVGKQACWYLCRCDSTHDSTYETEKESNTIEEKELRNSIH